MGDAHGLRHVHRRDLRRGRHPRAARRRQRRQQRLRLRDHGAGHGRPPRPAVQGRDELGQARDGRRRPAVRLLPGQPPAGARHRDPVHEGGHGPRGQARGRQADGSRGRAAGARRHPGHGPHRLHPAERARARRLQGAGPRLRGRQADGGRPRARGRRLLRHRHGDGAGARSRRRSPRRCASRRSASAPARTATPRCSSGRTWPGCAVAGRRGSSRSTPTCAPTSRMPRARMPRRSPRARSRPPSTPSRPETAGPRETSNHHVAHGHPERTVADPLVGPAERPRGGARLPPALPRPRGHRRGRARRGPLHHPAGAPALAGARRRVRLRPGREQADPVGAHRDRRRRRRATSSRWPARTRRPASSSPTCRRSTCAPSRSSPAS